MIFVDKCPYFKWRDCSFIVFHEILLTPLLRAPTCATAHWAARARAGRRRSGGVCINGTISRHLIGFVKICVREIRNGQWQIDYFMSAAAAEKRVR